MCNVLQFTMPKCGLLLCVSAGLWPVDIDATFTSKLMRGVGWKLFRLRRIRSRRAGVPVVDDIGISRHWTGFRGMVASAIEGY